MLVLGIDPGWNNFAYALVKKEGEIFILKHWCTLKLNKFKIEQKKLGILYSALTEIIKKEKPDLIVIESVLPRANPDSALKLGYTQAIVLLISEFFRIPTEFIHPTEVKKIIAGNGKAGKNDLKQIFLNLMGSIIRKETETEADSHTIDAFFIAMSYLLKNQE